MQIWDTAGQEKYRALAPMYYRSAEIAILCFDLTNAESFRAAELWAEELAVKASEDLKIIVVGNKSDLVAQRTVDESQGREFARRSKAAGYFECSAKTGVGIGDIFGKAAELLEDANESPGVITEIQPAAVVRKDECC
jgi:small GTP-binding protein